MICMECWRTHSPDDVRVVGSLFEVGPRQYRANYVGAPSRTTRETADVDMCRHRQAQHGGSS